MIKTLDHVGIVVENLDKALKIYSQHLGLELVETREIEDVGLRIAVLRAGEIFIELLEYQDSNFGTAKALRGDLKGLNHICYQVDQFDETMEKLRKNGFELIEGFPRIGIHGRIAFFIPPHSAEERIEILEMEPRDE